MPELNENQFNSLGEITFRVLSWHTTQHQMAAYAKVPTLMSDGSYYPMKDRIGELSWSKKTGVAKISVHPKYQRMGVGTALWNCAVEYSLRTKNVPPSASASTTRTDAGDAFLKKIDPNAGERKRKADDSFGDYWT